ncbi:hypothetical protein LGM90_02765 [Burkholderia sp. AU28942]|uniref:hypothetical protein n=1 Tax=Burkholderia TaxID=32008 RepID=UPI00084132C5|nr:MULTISPECIES: hypothetical protein [Burkholderia]AOK04166.1 hypothetical protein WK25_06615 [Burkholderia latens]MCA8307435.1 hypothetical protein [Burkholderia sp. AU28942]QTO49555.1 hypothetical protein J8I86_06415 [Burkholderia latens]
MNSTPAVRVKGTKKLLEVFESALSAIVQVFYTTVPLVILFIVTAILGGGDMMSVFGGSEAMFVAVIAFIDASRDSIRAVYLQSESKDAEKVDTMAIVSIILVVMAVAVLILSIAIDKRAIAMVGDQVHDFEVLVKNVLVLALTISCIYKFRLKRLEDSQAKERANQMSVPARG